MADQPGHKYAFLNLAKALSAGSAKRIRQWRDVLAGMQAGDLIIGNRTPVAGMPKWATPEVVRGGFATGAFAAGGDLLDHEETLARTLGLKVRGPAQTRSALNAWHLSEPGLAHLREMAESHAFVARYAEETALMVVALIAEDAPDKAHEILAEITPFFDRLRFYPAPGPTPPKGGVFVRSVAEIVAQLQNKGPRAEIVTQHITLTLWLPLYDRLVDLMAERDAPGWDAQAAEWLRAYKRAAEGPMPTRWSKPNRPFQRLRRAAQRMHDTGVLPPELARDVDTIVARHRAKYGTGAARDAYRADQARQDVTVLFDAVAQIVATRLGPLLPEFGIPEPQALSGPIAASEARAGAPAQAPLPASIQRSLVSARMAPVETLVADGQIGAPEVLAQVLPQLTAQLYAEGLRSPAESHACQSLYHAFSNRRSLLLLRLQSQIRLEELPWAQALLDRRAGGHSSRRLARAALTELARLSLSHFPHVIFPNPLIREFSNLGRLAGLRIPFTGEVAADIFMGAFSSTFTEAAEIAWAYYDGTLYGRYHDLPAPGRKVELARLCAERAGQRQQRNWSVAANGMIIEQQQILTSHNLAQLFSEVDLADLPFPDMSVQCFEWICARQANPPTGWRAQLQMTKNTAFAWRQMVAFLSELDPGAQQKTAARLWQIKDIQPQEVQAQLGPPLSALDRTIRTGAPPAPSERVLGWRQGRSSD